MKLGFVFFGGSRGKCPGDVCPRFANHVEIQLAPSKIITLDDVNSQRGHSFAKQTCMVETYFKI